MTEKLKRDLKRLLNKESIENSKKIEEIQLEIDQIQTDIDYLCELVKPDMPRLFTEYRDVHIASVELTDEVFQKIYKYCENKNFIFMGVS